MITSNAQDTTRPRGTMHPRTNALRSGIVAVAMSLAAVVLVMACESGPTGPEPDPPSLPTFVLEGLEGESVWALEEYGDRIYAGTEDGIWMKARGTDSSEWKALGLRGRRVNDILLVEDGSLLAALVPGREPGTEASLYRSSSGGRDWESVEDAPGTVDGPGEIESLAQLPDGTILAGGGVPVIARSDDGGERWETVWGSWGTPGLGTHFVVVDPTDPSVIWAGGEVGSFNPFLVRSSDGGRSWSDVTLGDGAGNDDAVNSFVVDPRNGDVVYAGWEGLLKRSLDGGETWETVLAPPSEPYFFGLDSSPTDPDRIFATGVARTAERKNLVLWWSGDRGDTWTEIRQSTDGDGNALSLLVTGSEEVLVGTESGLFRVLTP